jgi:hypothetical protein
MPQDNVSFYAAIAYLLSGDDMKHDKVRKRAADFCRTELKNRWSKVFEESCENSNVFKESATVTYKEILLIAAWLYGHNNFFEHMERRKNESLEMAEP